MNPQQWERVKELFDSALAVEPGERDAFLRRACGEDASLLAELESLLLAYESDRSAPRPSTGEAANSGDSKFLGQRIGVYQVIRQIGAGGMGAVYLARRADEAYNKSVAIKLVQARVDTQEILGRFRHERQILASLDHPNIAKLLDGGTTDDGLPYFVMDYVEGTRLDEYCDSRKLSVPERIKLFVDVCAAVQYVHQNLVVHRDLKPSNILVTPEGVPKLLDFGIAKLLKPELFSNPIDATRVEFRLMTPGYASPEQVRGDPITTVSDVYSLGVILYELLTAHRPYQLKTDSPIDVLRAVCDQEPPKPSTAAVGSGSTRVDKAREPAITPEQVAGMRATVPVKLKRQLAGDLDTIVLKALRKEPQRRYSSVEQLSEDLRRHLQGLPVKAHADSWSYRTQKFVGRHRAGVAAAALVVMSLVAGVFATSWQARIARTERARAERQFNDVRRLSTSFLFEFHSAIENLPGSTPARQLLVQRALEYLSKLAEEARGDRRLRRELAEAYLKVGDVQGNPYAANLGDTQGAAGSYNKALSISKALVEGDSSDGEAKRYVARSHKSLGEVLPQLGSPTEAVRNFRQATGMFETLIAANPGDTGLREELANSYQALGDVQGHAGLQNLGDPAAALESYRKALAIYEGLVAGDNRNKTARRGVALLQIRIGDLQEFRDDLNGALQAHRRALEISERLATEDPTNAEDQRRLALAYRKVGGLDEDLGAYPDALNAYGKAASINEALMNVDPTNAQAAMSYAISVRWSGDLLKTMGNTAGALVKYRRVLEILERLSATQTANVTVRSRYSSMLVLTARTLAEEGSQEQARALASRGLALARELASRADATPDDLSQHALDFLTCEPPDLRDPVAALRYAKQSVALSGGADSDALDILAQAYFQNGDAAQAIAAEERALGLLAQPRPGQPEPPTRRRIESHLVKFRAAKTRK